MQKFNRNYKIKFEIGHRAENLIDLIPEDIVEVEYPFTLKFKTANGTNLSNVGQCSLQLFNLPENVQKRLWKDNYNNNKYILMELCAGYGDVMPLIFYGFVTQCYSYRESGAVDYITDIQADNNSLINLYGFANTTIAKGVQFDDVLKYLIDKVPGYKLGYITPAIKPLANNRTFIGQTMDLLGKEYGGYDIFIDNNELNVLDKNDVVPGNIMVITAESGLLGSPKRANRFLSCEMIFEPRIKLCQAIELRSESLPWFNQLYKVITVEHQGTISPVECGTLTTKLTLSLGEDPYNELQKATGTNYGGKPTKGPWLKPVQGGRITDKYGWRIHPKNQKRQFHSGLDIGVPYNTQVVAPANGKVIMSNWYGGYGKCIQIDHGKINGQDVISLYGHLNQWLVNYQNEVYQGQPIGLVGSTGYSTGPHLHFEVRQNNRTVDPINYVGNFG